MNSGMLLTDELRAILRGLAATVAGMPACQYRDGYEAALLAVALSVGVADPDATQTHRAAEPRHDNVFSGAGWVGAFRGM